MNLPNFDCTRVIPAEAGTHVVWVPGSAGMTI